MPVIPPNSANGSVSLRRVSLVRADAALQKVAIFASVNLIATMASTLPWAVFRGVGADKTMISSPPWLDDPGGDGHGLSDFLWQLYFCWCLRGNVVGIGLERSPQTNQFTRIVLQHPDDVSVQVDPEDATRVVWRANGKEIPSGQVWHRRVYPAPGRALGLSPIALHALTISEGLHAQNFATQFFLDGAHPSAILTNVNAREISQEAAATIKERFLAAIRGTREPAVLGGGWEYKPIQIAPAESQFLETQGYTSAECARIYGPGMPEILGYETNNSMTYANVEQRAVDLLKFTLDPWLVRGEKIISELLPSAQYFRFDRKALLRTDTLSRFQAHQVALKNAFMTADEVRMEEDLAPVPWGSAPYLPALGPAAAAAAIKDDSTGPDQPQAVLDPKGGQPV
jgi:HK97 family phage portal protein